MASTRVCRRLYVLRASHALVQATVGVGTVIIVYIGVACTGVGGLFRIPWGVKDPRGVISWRLMGRDGSTQLRSAREAGVALF